MEHRRAGFWRVDFCQNESTRFPTGSDSQQFKTAVLLFVGNFFIRLGAAIVLTLVLVVPVSAQESSECLSCHGDTGLVVIDSTGAEHSLYVDAAQMERSMHAGFDCVTCHADVTEIPHAEKLAPAVCGKIGRAHV